VPAQTPYSVRQVDAHCGSSERCAERTPMAVPRAGMLLLAGLLAVALLPPVRAAPVCDSSATATSPSTPFATRRTQVGGAHGSADRMQHQASHVSVVCGCAGWRQPEGNLPQCSQSALERLTLS